MSIEKVSNETADEKFSDPEISEAFDEFNFEALRNIFEEYALKSGIDPSDMGFVEPDDIHQEQGLKSLLLLAGSYSPFEKNISVAEGPINLASKFNGDKKAIFFSTLVHEQVHALGHSKVETHEEDILFGALKRKITTTTTGSMEIEQAETFGDDILRDTKLRWFNEGMVDELASIIYQEYVDREQPAPFDDSKTMDFFTGYPVARTFIRALRDRIAEESGVPEEIVWGSLVRLYIEGESIASIEIKQCLQEVFSEKFFTRLSNINTGSSNPINMMLVFKEVLTPDITKKIIKSVKKHLADEIDTV